MYRKHFFFLFMILFIAKTFAGSGDYAERLLTIREKFAPDERFSVFTIKVKTASEALIASGDVDNPDAKAAVLKMLKEDTQMRVIDEIHVLPEASLGNKIYGITTLSVGNVRKHPDNKSEMLTQILSGTVITLLKDGGYFWQIKMPDGYIGWVNKLSFVQADSAAVREWSNASKIIVTDHYGMLYRQPEKNSEPVCDVVTGCILKKIGTKESWIEAELADGRRGFLQNEIVKDIESWMQSRRLTGENIEKTARTFLGIPYLWGGTSVKGFDCSGFVKTVYLLNGKILLRDADQQAMMGKPVDPGTNFENLKKGDLLFFGRKTTTKKREHIKHVAIYLGSGTFIHSSGCVRLTSFDPSSPLYEETLFKQFVRARRIIPD
jgi:SH3-like domain-containing protein